MVIRTITSTNKSSIDKLFQCKAIKHGDCIEFIDGIVHISGTIIKTKKKVWIERDDTRYPSIPKFLSVILWNDYEADLSWMSKVVINNVPYMELHKQIGSTQNEYSAKISLLSVATLEDGSIIPVWYIENNGLKRFPSDTIIRYKDADRDNYMPIDIPIGFLRPGEHVLKSSFLPTSVHTNKHQKYRWTLLASRFIHNGSLYYKK